MNITLAGVQLPDDLDWSDEYTAWKVGQIIRRSLTGALVVQEAAMQAGRPVTLQTTSIGDGSYVAPITLDVLEALRVLEEIAAGAAMSLVLPIAGGGTRTLTVRWRRTDGAAIEARPLKQIVPAEPTDYYAITLRLITV